MEGSVDRKQVKSVVPKPTRMPYINFVQAFRNTYQGPPKPAKEMIRMAAKSWNKLNDEEKRPFVEMAEQEKSKPQLRRKTGIKRLKRARRSYE